MPWTTMDVRELTQEELYSLEHTLRKIPDKEKSSAGFELAMAIKAEIRKRYELLTQAK